MLKKQNNKIFLLCFFKIQWLLNPFVVYVDMIKQKRAGSSRSRYITSNLNFFFAEAYLILVWAAWPRTWTAWCSTWWTPAAGCDQSLLHCGLYFWDKSSSERGDAIPWQLDVVLQNGKLAVTFDFVVTRVVVGVWLLQLLLASDNLSLFWIPNV